MDKKTNLTLIGMAACGKSTTGVLLAKALNMRFVDTDIVLQQRHGQLLPDMLTESGMEEFIRRESAVIRSLDGQNTCIATGGSAVYAGDAMAYLQQHSVIVWLDLAFPEIQKRLGDIKSRGVVTEAGKTLYEIFCERRPLYEQYANITVCADQKNAEELVAEIVERFHQFL